MAGRAGRGPGVHQGGTIVKNLVRLCLAAATAATVLLPAAPASACTFEQTISTPAFQQHICV